MKADPEPPEEWRLLQRYSSAWAAEADAAYLRAEGVAAEVQAFRDFPGTDHGASLMVDARLEHRARWLLKLEPVSEAELEFLATGTLESQAEGGRSEPDGPRWPKVIVVTVLLLGALLALLQIAGTVGIGER
jgi:hypothetical protein